MNTTPPTRNAVGQLCTVCTGLGCIAFLVGSTPGVIAAILIGSSFSAVMLALDNSHN